MKRADIPMRDVLNAAREFHDGTVPHAPFIDLALQRLHPTAPLKVINAQISHAVRLGYIECGVSERTGWLTERGKRFLETESHDQAMLVPGWGPPANVPPLNKVAPQEGGSDGDSL